MIELRFPRAVYAGTAVDEAVKRYARFARCDLSEAPEHWIVRLEALGAATPARERAVAGELGNWALGVTIRTRSAR